MCTQDEFDAAWSEVERLQTLNDRLLERLYDCQHRLETCGHQLKMATDQAAHWEEHSHEWHRLYSELLHDVGHVTERKDEQV